MRFCDLQCKLYSVKEFGEAACLGLCGFTLFLTWFYRHLILTCGIEVFQA